MIISDLKYYHNLDFDQYIALPGFSFSGFKGDVPDSPGLRLGHMVHTYLLEPTRFDWNHSHMNEVKRIAAAIRGKLGVLLPTMQKELSITANFHHNGLTLPYKGRIDLGVPGSLIIDLKILSGSLHSAIERFGYDHQLSGYCVATSTPIAMIVSFNKKIKDVESAIITPSKDWWQYRVLTHGIPDHKLGNNL